MLYGHWFSFNIPPLLIWSIHLILPSVFKSNLHLLCFDDIFIPFPYVTEDKWKENVIRFRPRGKRRVMGRTQMTWSVHESFFWIPQESVADKFYRFHVPIHKFRTSNVENVMSIDLMMIKSSHGDLRWWYIIIYNFYIIVMNIFSVLLFTLLLCFYIILKNPWFINRYDLFHV